MAVASNHGTIYSDVNYRRTLLPDRQKEAILASRIRHFYNSSENKEVVPQGFPSMAVTRACWPNTTTFRTFECLNLKQLDFYETKLSYLENQLHKLDKAEDRAMKGLQRSQVPFNKKSFVDCRFKDSDPLCALEVLEANENMSQDEFTDLREKLFAHIECLSKKHRELVCWLQKARTFPRVHREGHLQLFTMAQEVHGLDKDALDHWRAIDEMAYASINPVELWIQNIWLSTAPWLKKILRRFPTKSALPEHNGSQAYTAVGVNRFRKTLIVLVLLFSLSLVLVPAGLIYLGELGKPGSFAVVGVFGGVFAIGIIFVEQHTNRVVVAIVAYLAVLATFLGNTS